MCDAAQASAQEGWPDHNCRNIAVFTQNPQSPIKTCDRRIATTVPSRGRGPHSTNSERESPGRFEAPRFLRDHVLLLTLLQAESVEVSVSCADIHRSIRYCGGGTYSSAGV